MTDTVQDELLPFTEIQFPADISYGSSGGPQYVDSINIDEEFHQPRNRYNVAYGIKTKAQLDTLIAFFRARKGRACGFRFKDWTDYQCIAGSIGSGDGIIKQFQLMRIYRSGSVVAIRNITKPVIGTVNIYANSVPNQSGFSVDYETGIVTFMEAPANGVALTADFEFDVPVKFDTDRLSASLDAYGCHTWLDIPLIEVNTRTPAALPVGDEREAIDDEWPNVTRKAFEKEFVKYLSYKLNETASWELWKEAVVYARAGTTQVIHKPEEALRRAKKEAEGRLLPLQKAAKYKIHPDDFAVDKFANAMKIKLAKKRDEGRAGWEDPAQCGIRFLWQLLHEHVAKGDPVDIGNLAMMIWNRQQSEKK